MASNHVPHLVRHGMGKAAPVSSFFFEIFSTHQHDGDIFQTLLFTSSKNSPQSQSQPFSKIFSQSCDYGMLYESILCICSSNVAETFHVHGTGTNVYPSVLFTVFVRNTRYLSHVELRLSRNRFLRRYEKRGRI